MQKYSVEEKKKILEDFLLSQASGESVESVCERVGVGRPLLYYWKSILDRGGDLEDIMADPEPSAPPPEPDPDPDPQPPTTQERMTSKQGYKRTDIPDARKAHAAKRLLRGSVTVTEIANEFGVAWGTVDGWLQKYKAGGFGAVDETLVNGQPKRGTAGGRPRTPNSAPKPQPPPPPPAPAPKTPRKSRTPPPSQRTEIVQFRDPPAAPVQLGLALTESDQLTLLRAENARLKSKIRQLIAMVIDDD